MIERDRKVIDKEIKDSQQLKILKSKMKKKGRFEQKKSLALKKTYRQEKRQRQST